MSEGHVSIDTRLDNSKIPNDLKELENMVKNGAEGVTGEFAQRVERLSATWAKLEAQQSKNNAKIQEFKARMSELRWYMNLDVNAGRKAEPLQLEEYNQLAQKLKEAEAGAKGLESSMSKVGVDAQKTKNAMTGTSGESEKVKNSTLQSGSNMNRGLRTLMRWAGALLGVRAMYSGIRKAANAWMASTEEGAKAQAELQGIWASLGQTLAPVFKWIIGTLKTVLGYINAITKAFFGFELFSRTSAKNLGGAVKQAKELRKQLAGFDEMNVLGSNGQQNLNGDSVGGSVDFNVETPDIAWLEKIKPLIDILVGAFKLLFEWISRVALWIAEYFVKGLIVLAEWFGKNDEWVTILVASLGGLLIAFQAFKLLQGLSPFGWVVLAIVAIITAIGWLHENWDSVVKFFDDTIKSIANWFGGLGTWVKEVWENAINSVRDWFNGLITSIQNWWHDSVTFLSTKLQEFINFWKNVWNGAKDLVISYFSLIGGFWTGILGGVWKEAGKVFGNIKGIFDGLVSFLTGVFTGNWRKAWEGIVKVFQNIMGGLANMFKAPFNIIIDGINGFIRALNKIKIPDWVPSWLGGGRGFNISPIPKLARGGITTSATTAIIGEAGREAVIPLQNNTGWAEDFLSVLDSYGGSLSSNQRQLIQVVLPNGKVLAELVNNANDESNFATNGGYGYGY